MMICFFELMENIITRVLTRMLARGGARGLVRGLAALAFGVLGVRSEGMGSCKYILMASMALEHGQLTQQWV